MGYLQAVCKPEMWTLFKEYCETNFVIPADTDFEKGLEYLRETYYKKNDVFILKMKAAADTFKGKTFVFAKWLSSKNLLSIELQIECFISYRGPLFADLLR